MKAFISSIIAVAAFILTSIAFSLIAKEFSAALYFGYEEPITVGAKTSYEVHGDVTPLGMISTYLSLLVSVLVFCMAYYRDLSWLTQENKLLIKYLSAGVLSVLIMQHILSVVLLEFSWIPISVYNLLGVVSFIGLIYLSWRIFYYRYMECKSTLQGYSLWACVTDNIAGEDYCAIMEAKSEKEAMKYAKHSLHFSENLKDAKINLFPCASPKGVLRKCETSEIKSHISLKDIKLLDSSEKAQNK